MRVRAQRVALSVRIATVCCVPLVVSVAASASDDVLLSRDRPIVPSSTKWPAYAAGRAVDGKTRTRWPSMAGPGTQWLQVDLGRRETVHRVTLRWQRAYAKSNAGLMDPKRKEIAFELVSSAENSTLNWHAQFGYIEDIGDGRGYTGGIVGFCSGTSDMLAVVAEYTKRKPDNGLAGYLPALRAVDGTDSHVGLDPGFRAAWRAAAADPVFQKTQQDERDQMYFTPAVTLAKKDGLRALGQFAYYDAAVMHGVDGLRGIRAAALRSAKTPATGGDEVAYLTAFLNARVREMRTEEAHSDTSRVDTAQRVFLAAGNLDLKPPLRWKVYGDQYSVR